MATKTLAVFPQCVGLFLALLSRYTYVRSNDRFRRQQRTRYAHIEFFGS
jgi:hypothetical protein